jgi:hypothetical protein
MERGENTMTSRWMRHLVPAVIAVAFTLPVWATALAQPGHGARSAKAAIQAVIEPHVRPYTGACQQRTNWQGCPLTVELRRRLQTARLPVDLLCRCQNTALRVSILGAQKLVTGDGRLLVRVKTDWFYGGSTHSHITFLVAFEQGAYNVSDSYCTARNGTPIFSTNLFVKNPPPCP